MTRSTLSEEHLKHVRQHQNLILIGMPGSGKSTLGQMLAGALHWPLLDTDRVIELRQQNRLQTLIDQKGLDRFLSQEEEALMSLKVEQTVIATGGSVIYSEEGMANLQQQGVLIWLDVPLDELTARIHNMGQRGLATQPGQTFAELYQQRLPLYQHWAQVRFTDVGLTPDETLSRLLKQISELPEPIN